MIAACGDWTPEDWTPENCIFGEPSKKLSLLPKQVSGRTF
jgi:hypothetical protein